MEIMDFKLDENVRKVFVAAIKSKSIPTEVKTKIIESLIPLYLPKYLVNKAKEVIV